MSERDKCQNHAVKGHTGRQSLLMGWDIDLSDGLQNG